MEPERIRIRSYIPLNIKSQILDRLENGEKVSQISRDLNLRESTIRSVRNNKIKVKAAVSASGSQKTSVARSQIMIKLERSLVQWLEEMNEKNVDINGSAICKKAQKLFVKLREDPELSETAPKKFNASHGWLYNFYIRNDVGRSLRCAKDDERDRDVIIHKTVTAVKLKNAENTESTEMSQIESVKMEPSTPPPSFLFCSTPRDQLQSTLPQDNQILATENINLAFSMIQNAAKLLTVFDQNNERSQEFYDKVLRLCGDYQEEINFESEQNLGEEGGEMLCMKVEPENEMLDLQTE